MCLPAPVRDAQSSLSTHWSRGSVDADEQTTRRQLEYSAEKEGHTPCGTLVPHAGYNRAHRSRRSVTCSGIAVLNQSESMRRLIFLRCAQWRPSIWEGWHEAFPGG